MANGFPGWGRAPAFQRHLELRQAPRSLSLGARVAVTLGFGVQMAALMGAFSFIFFWIFVWQSELITKLELRGPIERTTGRVTNIERTAGNENKAPILEVSFSFEANGATVTASSYGKSGLPQVGSTVEVEYVRGKPSVARVVGLRRRPFGSSVAFVLLFPTFALAAFVSGIATGVRRTRLLAHGQLGHARLIEKRPTNNRVNKRQVFEYTFELELPPEATSASYRAGWEAWAKTHRFKFNTHEGESIEDEPREPVLYEPTRPGSGVPLDALPVRVVHPGDFDANDAWPLRLILPGILLFNLAVIVAKLLSL